MSEHNASDGARKGETTSHESDAEATRDGAQKGHEGDAEGAQSGAQAPWKAERGNGSVITGDYRAPARNLNPFPPGVSGNPGGRPKGASVRAAVLRALGRRPDADGIGELANELGDGTVKAALALASAVDNGMDPDGIKGVKTALDGLLAFLESFEPRTNKVETTSRQQRVVLNITQPGGMSETATGPIHDAPLPSLQPPSPSLPPHASRGPSLPSSSTGGGSSSSGRVPSGGSSGVGDGSHPRAPMVEGEDYWIGGLTGERGGG